MIPGVESICISFLMSEADVSVFYMLTSHFFSPFSFRFAGHLHVFVKLFVFQEYCIFCL